MSPNKNNRLLENMSCRRDNARTFPLKMVSHFMIPFAGTTLAGCVERPQCRTIGAAQGEKPTVPLQKGFQPTGQSNSKNVIVCSCHCRFPVLPFNLLMTGYEPVSSNSLANLKVFFVVLNYPSI
jgi:hypothetical protein